MPNPNIFTSPRKSSSSPFSYFILTRPASKTAEWKCCIFCVLPLVFPLNSHYDLGLKIIRDSPWTNLQNTFWSFTFRDSRLNIVGTLIKSIFSSVWFATRWNQIDDIKFMFPQGCFTEELSALGVS